MHRLTFAARRSAWYDDDDEDDGPNYNPFRKFLSKRTAPNIARAPPLVLEHGEVELGNIPNKKSRLKRKSIFDDETFDNHDSIAEDQSSVNRDDRARRVLIVEFRKAALGGIAYPRFGEFILPVWTYDATKKVFSKVDSSKSLKPETMDYLFQTTTLEGETDLRIIYVRNDLDVFQQLTRNFDIRFARQKTDFFEWGSNSAIGTTPGKLDTRQTISWKPAIDRNHQLIRTAFGLEYPISSLPSVQSHAGTETQLAVLQDIYNPAQKGLDYHVHRISVFLQLRIFNDGIPEPPGPSLATSHHHTLSNTMLLYDTRKYGGGFCRDELLPGRMSWKQLLQDVDLSNSSTDQIVLSAAVQLVFEAVAGKWSDYILSIHDYIASLEEEIYEQPANDTRTSALWSISKQLLQAERLMKFHILLLGHLQNDLRYTAPNSLDQVLAEYLALSSEIEETLKKPIANMVDLIYKSISIRDARQSLELNTSLWRLSWITFIFLPLTFLAGVFGMNVSIFENNPPIKWYFIAAAPLMVIVMISWLIARKSMRKGTDGVQTST